MSESIIKACVYMGTLWAGVYLCVHNLTGIGLLVVLLCVLARFFEVKS